MAFFAGPSENVHNKLPVLPLIAQKTWEVTLSEIVNCEQKSNYFPSVHKSGNVGPHPSSSTKKAIFRSIRIDILITIKCKNFVCRPMSPLKKYDKKSFRNLFV